MAYIAEDFDLQRAGDYTLLARVGGPDHALAVIDAASTVKFFARFDPEVPGQDVLDLLDARFGAAKLATYRAQQVFVPAGVFDERHLRSYLRHLPADGLMDVRVTDVPPLGIKAIHQVSADGLERYGNQPQQVVYPAVQPLLHSVANQALDATGPVIAIDRHPTGAIICLLDRDVLMYSNDFEVYGVDDLNYYILQVLAEFGVANGDLRCCLSGEVDKDGEVHGLLANLFGNVELADSAKWTGITAPEGLGPETHRLVTLFGLALCG